MGELCFAMQRSGLHGLWLQASEACAWHALALSCMLVSFQLAACSLLLCSSDSLSHAQRVLNDSAGVCRKQQFIHVAGFVRSTTN